jgi:TIR domain-containing protein
MKAAVFISYALSDAATADQVRLILHESGISCWIAPREAQPGETWVASIDSAMSEVKALLLLFSSAANTSRHVARELQLAEAANIRTLCVRIDQAEPSGNIQYFLAHAQRLDIAKDQLSSRARQLELVNAVKALVDSPPDQTRRSKYLLISVITAVILFLIGAALVILRH